MPTRCEEEEASVERVLLSGEASEAEIGEASYFVVDGHHRVSVTPYHYHEVPTLEAAVSEFHPKLPAAPVPEAERG